MMIEIIPEEGRREEDWRRYDPACERIDTAVKAIWLLYRRARWNLLEEVMGMDRSDLERIFGQFDMQFVASDHGRIRTESQVFALLRAFNMEVDVKRGGSRYTGKVTRKRKINPLLAAAMGMVLDYKYIYCKQRGQHESSNKSVS
jgi:hypothetical protein